jgi:hypothetical protein
MFFRNVFWEKNVWSTIKKRPKTYGGDRKMAKKLGIPTVSNRSGKMIWMDLIDPMLIQKSLLTDPKSFHDVLFSW